MDKTVCPWCQTEIVWDEETGPEEQCPYCYNDLKDYRTITIGEDKDEPVEENKENRASVLDDDYEVLDDEIKAWTQAFDDEAVDVYRYEQKVKALQQEQEDMETCPTCHEVMIVAGTAPIGGGNFQAIEALKEALQSPLQVKVLMCPSCFLLKWKLADEQRISIIDHLSNS